MNHYHWPKGQIKHPGNSRAPLAAVGKKNTTDEAMPQCLRLPDTALSYGGSLCPGQKTWIHTTVSVTKTYILLSTLDCTVS